jgi:hypothetical protein
MKISKLKQMASRAGRRLLLSDLPPIQYRIVWVIIEQSLAKGLASVISPSQDVLAAICGHHRSDVNEAIGALREKGVVRSTAVDGGFRYQLVPPDEWQVPLRIDPREIEFALQKIREANRPPATLQLELFAPIAVESEDYPSGCREFRQPHVHDSCTSSGTKEKVHVHERRVPLSGIPTRHEVGELEPVTTEQILSLILKHARLTPEFIEGWRARIEREGQAELVMSLARDVDIDRRTTRKIRNPAAWLNYQYLKVVNKAPVQASARPKGIS